MGCIAAVTPHLDNVQGVQSWNVDLQDPQRVLTVTLEPSATVEAVQQALKDAGYSGEVLSAGA